MPDQTTQPNSAGEMRPALYRCGQCEATFPASSIASRQHDGERNADSVCPQCGSDEIEPAEVVEARPVATHTPGLWKYLPDESMIETAGPVNLRGEYGHVCDFRSPVNEADARLISAAPDLLEACEALLRETGSRKLDIKKDFSLILYRETARRAIAKAKGEAK